MSVTYTVPSMMKLGTGSVLTRKEGSISRLAPPFARFHQNKPLRLTVLRALSLCPPPPSVNFLPPRFDGRRDEESSAWDLPIL